MLVINLGGAGEIPGVLNQQPEWVEHDPNNWWSPSGETLDQLRAKGADFLFASNLCLPFEDDSHDVVYTNSVPVDITTHMGPGVQSSEIRRILKSGGVWIRDGVVYYRMP